MRLVDGSGSDGGDPPRRTGARDERTHFMRCPYCDEFFDMRDLSEVTRHYDFSLTATADGTVALWPIIGHAAPRLHTDPKEIAWLEELHGAKGEAVARGVAPNLSGQ